MPLAVILADNHLLAVNKPPGLLTQPSGTDRDSLEAQAKAWVKAEYQKPGAVFLEAVHRLDQPVSGVVLFGRTSKAVARLNASIRERKVRKVYLAVVAGRLPAASGELRHWLRHDDYHAAVVPAGSPGASEARLQYRVLGTRADRSLVEILLETGRYHQIRAQFAASGCPIAGDRKYGATLPGPAGGIALHHQRLEIQHPVRAAETVTLLAPTPADWPW